MHDPERGRSAGEGGEQGAAGLRGVLDRHRLAGEQEREVEVVLGEGLRAEALGELGGLRVAGLAALDHGEDPAGDGGDQEHGDGGEQAAQPPVGATRPRRLVLGGVAAAATNSRSSAFSSTACSAVQSSAATRRAPR